MKKICEICGSTPAMYVCSECGRSICRQCFEPGVWVCSDCYRTKEQDYAQHDYETSSASFPLFMKVFLVGFLLIFLGIAILMIAGLMGWISQSFGLVVFVGPIPIILGAGKNSLLAILLAIILTILGIVLFVILKRQSSWSILQQDIKSL